MADEKRKIPDFFSSPDSEKTIESTEGRIGQAETISEVPSAQPVEKNQEEAEAAVDLSSSDSMESVQPSHPTIETTPIEEAEQESIEELITEENKIDPKNSGEARDFLNKLLNQTK